MEHDTATATAGWIVRIDGTDRAAGPTRSEALTTAEAIGFREHFGTRASVRPATAADLNSLDLPPSALGIDRDGGAPWWRESAAEAQRRFAAENDATADRLTAAGHDDVAEVYRGAAREHAGAAATLAGAEAAREAGVLDLGGAIAPPEGPPDRPVYDVQGDGGEPWPDWRGPVVHAWGAVYDHDPETGAPAREYLGRGRLIGWLHRERAYWERDDAIGMVPHFSIAGQWPEARADLDVALPIVEDDCGRYLPEYLRCPDCGGRIAWAEAGRVPGSRRCEGATEPDLPAAGGAADPPGVASEPDGCGSTFALDSATRTRYRVRTPPTMPRATI